MQIEVFRGILIPFLVRTPNMLPLEGKLWGSDSASGRQLLCGLRIL